MSENELMLQNCKNTYLTLLETLLDCFLYFSFFYLEIMFELKL